MEHIKDFLPKNQELFKKNVKSQVEIRPDRQPSLRDRFDVLLSEMRVDRREATIRTVEVLLEKGLKYINVFPKQGTIGREVGRSRKWVNEIVQLLQESGIIRVHNRGYDTCLYFVEEIFKQWASLQSIFPVLKSLGLWLLLSANNAQGVTTVTPISHKQPNVIKVSNYTIVRESQGGALVGISTKKRKRDVVNAVVKPITRHIGAQLSFTEYALLIIDMFPKEVLEVAYSRMQRYRNDSGDPFKYFWSICKEECERRKIEPDTATMIERVKASGFKPGDRLLLSDPEAQPNYQEKKEPSTGMKQHQKQKAAHNALNEGAAAWLKSSGCNKDFTNEVLTTGKYNESST